MDINLTADNIILVSAVLIFISIIASRAGFRFGIPTLLLFLVVGMIFGSDGLGVKFYNAGNAQFIGMIALSIILFSGGMETSFKDIRPVLPQGIILSTAGVFLTALLTGIFIFWISGFDFTNIYLPIGTSLLLAATMSSTDSASVFSILRGQKIHLKYNLRHILELESGSNDPMAYMLTIALIQYAKSSDIGIGTVIADFFIQFIIGGLIGFIIGKGAVRLINRLKIPIPSLYSLLLLSLTLFTFSITDLLRGNGYLAVYIAGVIVGNHKIVYKKEITTFLDGMTMLFQIIMFLSLGLLVNPGEMIHVIPVAVLIGVFMMLIARPASVFLTLLPFKKMSGKAKLFISWVGLRGAVPIIFATYPVVAGVENSDQIFNIVFVITLLSLILQGMTITSAAKRFGLDLPYEDGKSKFGVELPDDLRANLKEVELTPQMLENGHHLKDMTLPPKTLVMLVKRGENFMVPNGRTKLEAGDILLIIREDEQDIIRDTGSGRN